MDPRRRACTVVALVACLLSGRPVDARAGEARSVAWEGMTSFSRFTNLPLSLDPDRPRLEYGNLGGRWHAMAGGEVVLFGLRSPWVAAGLTAMGFIELVNFDDSDPMPWQSFRASFGLGAVVSSPTLDRRLPRGGGLSLEILYAHESDHALDLDTYEAIFLQHDPHHELGVLVHGNMSAYEYVKLRLGYRQPLPWRMELCAALSGRIFPEPIADVGRRRLHGSVAGELQLAWTIVPRLVVSTGVFLEAVFNGFKAVEEAHHLDLEFKGGLDGDPLTYLRWELGVRWDPSGVVAFAPYLRVAHGHGRGLDFPLHSTEIDGGFRFYF